MGSLDFMFFCEQTTATTVFPLMRRNDSESPLLVGSQIYPWLCGGEAYQVEFGKATYSPWTYSHQSGLLAEMAYTDDERQVLREFGRRVRVARDAHGWTQEDLADEAGLDRTYVGSVERGERNLALLNVNKLALALGEKFDGFLPWRARQRRRR